MNIKQANIILEKINRLYKSMTLDPSNIDEFEQELMLSYIRQLHQSFSPEVKAKKKKKQKTELPPIVNIPKQEPDPLPKPKPKAVKPKPKATPPPKSKPKEVKIETPPAESKPNPAPSPKPEAPKVVVSTPSEDFSELFNQKEAKELSEKLSELPIKDLTKAMGLNEKIFTINELFGGDGKAFDTALKTLNTFNSFDQARAYLSENFAGQYKWTSRNKKKKAINLIKLIRRRYN